MRRAGCPTSSGRRWRPSMQCHLGLCLSLRCDFTLELFTRGLAGEHAYQHAQRLVAMIARCSSSRSASMLPTALISRPDHNAQLLTRSSCLRFGRAHRRSHRRPSRNCQIVWRSRRPGQARQPARDGAKRSGLTEPRIAGQSRIVMAELLSDDDARRENERDERDAQGWKTVGRCRHGAVSGGDSVRVRVHLYERSSPGT
jgi:hypothetical protein